jgi:hypothetical protein
VLRDLPDLLEHAVMIDVRTSCRSDDMVRLRKDRDAIDRHLQPRIRANEEKITRSNGSGGSSLSNDSGQSGSDAEGGSKAERVTLERLDLRMQKMEAMLQLIVGECRVHDNVVAPEVAAPGAVVAGGQNGTVAVEAAVSKASLSPAMQVQLLDLEPGTDSECEPPPLNP